MKLKLRGKFNLLILSLLILSVGITAFFLYQKEKEALILKSLTNIKTIVQLEGLKIDVLILEAMNDIKILSKSPTVQGIIRASKPKTETDSEGQSKLEILRSRLASIFKAFIAEKENYFQIRLIGINEGGSEVVRVEKNVGEIIETPKSKLQSKSHASYFKETIKLSPGQTHISPINLNKELGVVAEPHIATIRVATPVYDYAGNIFGLVVININLNSTLNSLVEKDKGFYVLNESGDFLAHQDSRFNFGFDLGKRHTIDDSFPGLASYWNEVEVGQDYSTIDMSTEEDLVYIWKQKIGPRGFDNHIGIMQRKHISEITRDLISAFDETLILILGLLMFSLVVGVYFSRRLTGPLEYLTHAAGQFAKGCLDNKVPIETSDEIGDLGKAFNAMVEERDKREVELKKLSNAVHQSPATIVITDINGDIEYANPSFYALNGFSWSDKLVGQNMNILNSGEHSPEFIKDFWDTILDGRIWKGEWCNKKKNGEIYWARAVTSSIKDKSGNISHFVEVKEDITEEKERDEQLRQSKLELEKSNQALQEFASYASHDLGEPLRKIKVFGGYLKEGSSNLEDKQKKYLSRMIKASVRMELLIEQLLEYSKVSYNSVKSQSFNLKEVIELVMDDLEILLAETGGIIEYDDLPSLTGDKLLIKQLFQNLIGNSLKFATKGVPPIIKISSSLEGSKYKIIVQDNGIGMGKENLERIFKPFDRLHGRSEYDGSGIGLAICRKVAEVHGGTITAESKLGKGSIFILNLPNNAPK